LASHLKREYLALENAAREAANLRSHPDADVNPNPDFERTFRFTKRRRKATQRDSIELDLGGAPRGPMPTNIKPMLATLGGKPFDRRGWLFEIKWDGYRTIAEVSGGRARLYSRNGLSFSQRYRPVTAALANLGHSAVLDGEVVVVDEQGRPDFDALENYRRYQPCLVYYVFDLLYLDGHDLRDLPLWRRKELLQQILPPLPGVRFCEHIEEEGLVFFSAVSKMGLEGMVAKDGTSSYQEGRRTDRWLKIKANLRQEAVIAGFTRPRRSRQHFGALVLGVYDGKELVHIGEVGGGFSERNLARVSAELAPLIQDRCPFRKLPNTVEPATWVKPTLVCEVRFTAWTATGGLRHPIFLGMRSDKQARAVRRESFPRAGAQATKALVRGRPR
jgi:bifunctional non-homologous end joining protein LigD